MDRNTALTAYHFFSNLPGNNLPFRTTAANLLRVTDVFYEFFSSLLGDVVLITLVEDEGDHEVNLVFDDVAVVNLDLLFFDPSAANIAYGFGCAGYPALDRVFKAFRGCRAYFSNPCHRHNYPPQGLLASMWMERSQVNADDRELQTGKESVVQ